MRQYILLIISCILAIIGFISQTFPRTMLAWTIIPLLVVVLLNLKLGKSNKVNSWGEWGLMSGTILLLLGLGIARSVAGDKALAIIEITFPLALVVLGISGIVTIVSWFLNE